MYDFLFSGNDAFRYCYSLSQIVLTSGLPQIGPGQGIFYGSGVTSVTIPSTVTAMGEFRGVITTLMIYKYNNIILNI